MKWPFQRLSDLPVGDKKVTLNHLGYIYIYIWVFPKIMVPPKHPFVHSVFHEINHPFWGVCPPIFGNIHRYNVYVTDYYTRIITFLIGNPNLNLNVPLLLGGGHIQGIYIYIHNTKLDPQEPISTSMAGWLLFHKCPDVIAVSQWNASY